jgi:phage/plasmid primase-like uncharacterized protein
MTTDLTKDFGSGGFNAAHYPPEPAFDRYAAIAEFTEEFRATGALISGYAVADGSVHRVKHKDDKSGSKNAWYVLYEHPDFISGCFGHWKNPDMRTTWTSFKHDEMSTKQRQDYAMAMEAARVRQEEERKRVHDEVAAECAAEYNDYPDATEAHPYLQKKQVASVPGLKWDGLIDLIVPMINEHGEIRNLQRINFDGKKLFTAGGEIKGCLFVIPGADSMVLTAEGLSTGLSLHMASGATVYVAFNAGNLPAVTAIARRRHPGAKLIVCGDNDRFTKNAKGEPMNPGRIAAEKAAKAAGPETMMVLPQFPDSDTDSTDFNDLQVRYGGSAAVKATLQAAAVTAVPAPAAAPGQMAEEFEFVDARSLTAHYRPVVSIIKGMIGQNHITFLSAPPASYKSFIALEMAFCVAAGIPFAGRKTRRMPVVYLAGEGHEGVKARLKALGIKHGQEASDWLIISKLPADLLDMTKNTSVVLGIFKACQAIGQLPGLIIVDTFHRNFSGDENSSRDFGQMLKNLDTQFRTALPDVSILFVHHTGHDDANKGSKKPRPRGTSAIKASCDTEWIAIRDGDTVTLYCVKFKDGREPEDMIFRSVEVDTGWRDEDGDPVTSLYLEYLTEGANEPKIKKRKLNAREDAILTALDRAIAEHGIEPPAELRARFGGFDGNIGQTRKVVQRNHWLAQALPVIVIDSKNKESEEDSKKKAFDRCLKKFIDLGIVQLFNDYWWRVDW